MTATALVVGGTLVCSLQSAQMVAAASPDIVVSAPEQVIGRTYKAHSKIPARTVGWRLTTLPKGTTYTHTGTFKKNGIWYVTIRANGQKCFIRLASVGH